jgi:hypothetical protein
MMKWPPTLKNWIDHLSDDLQTPFKAIIQELEEVGKEK